MTKRWPIEEWVPDTFESGEPCCFAAEDQGIVDCNCGKWIELRTVSMRAIAALKGAEAMLRDADVLRGFAGYDNITAARDVIERALRLEE